MRRPLLLLLVIVQLVWCRELKALYSDSTLDDWTIEESYTIQSNGSATFDDGKITKSRLIAWPLPSEMNFGDGTTTSLTATIAMAAATGDSDPNLCLEQVQQRVLTRVCVGHRDNLDMTWALINPQTVSLPADVVSTSPRIIGSETIYQSYGNFSATWINDRAANTITQQISTNVGLISPPATYVGALTGSGYLRISLYRDNAAEVYTVSSIQTKFIETSIATQID